MPAGRSGGHPLFLTLHSGRPGVPRRGALVASVGPELIFPTLPTAVAAYEQWRDGG